MGIIGCSYDLLKLKQACLGNLSNKIHREDAWPANFTFKNLLHHMWLVPLLALLTSAPFWAKHHGSAPRCQGPRPHGSHGIQGPAPADPVTPSKSVTSAASGASCRRDMRKELEEWRLAKARHQSQSETWNGKADCSQLWESHQI